MPDCVNFVRILNLTIEEYVYKLLKVNVDQLKLIQLGISLFDSHGKLPSGCKAWQFNFEFDLEKDQSFEISIEMLKKAKLEFKKHKVDGIRHEKFA